ncbi:MAG: GNAT family N-acetyltransferase [Rhodocyclaceae bacterium]
MHTTFHSSIADIDAADWDALNVSGSPFLTHAFLASAEQHGAAAPELGWHPRHASVYDASGALLGALPLYLRTHSFGDFSGDWHWAEAFERSGIRYYPKLVSGIPYTPASGPRFLVRPNVERRTVLRELVGGTLEQAAAWGVSCWQCLFLDEDVAVRAVLEENGFLYRRGCQFHWQNRGYENFEAFLATFAADKRKKVRRERRRIAESGLTLETRHGGEIDAALWQRIYPHYLSTFQRFGNHAAFSPDFFIDAGTALKEQLVVFLARAGSEVVAAAICYRSGTTLYGRHWGASADYHSLHFELCFYQGIDYCIEHGLSHFEPGAQGEHKVSRGFSPTATWSAFWVANPAMRQAVANHLLREQAAVAAYQDEMAMHEPYKR